MLTIWRIRTCPGRDLIFIEACESSNVFAVVGSAFIMRSNRKVMSTDSGHALRASGANANTFHMLRNIAPSGSWNPCFRCVEWMQSQMLQHRKDFGNSGGKTLLQGSVLFLHILVQSLTVKTDRRNY